VRCEVRKPHLERVAWVEGRRRDVEHRSASRCGGSGRIRARRGIFAAASVATAADRASDEEGGHRSQPSAGRGRHGPTPSPSRARRRRASARARHPRSFGRRQG
jgi:hypothetical protein